MTFILNHRWLVAYWARHFLKTTFQGCPTESKEKYASGTSLEGSRKPCCLKHKIYANYFLF